jgi:putative Holliday junction resolvase
MTKGRVRRAVGVDLGKARVGVAVTDELGLLAHSRGTLEGKSRKVLLAKLAAIAAKEQIRQFVVGLPLEMDGTHGAAAKQALAFAQQLADATGSDVDLVDERLSTVEAMRRLDEGRVARSDQRARIDGASAVVILQRWMDRH